MILEYDWYLLKFMNMPFERERYSDRESERKIQSICFTGKNKYSKSKEVEHMEISDVFQLLNDIL